MSVRDVFIRAHIGYVQASDVEKPAAEAALVAAFLYELAPEFELPVRKAMAAPPFRHRTLALAVRRGWRLRTARSVTL